MIYGKLLYYRTQTLSYKSESYLKVVLTFKILWFKKSIIQHLTMFDDWVLYKNHWNNLIYNELKQ